MILYDNIISFNIFYYTFVSLIYINLTGKMNEGKSLFEKSYFEIVPE